MGGVEFEVYSPEVRPGREEDDFLTIDVHQHALKGGHRHVAVALAGDVIEIGSPECREAAVLVFRRKVKLDSLRGADRQA